MTDDQHSPEHGATEMLVVATAEAILKFGHAEQLLGAGMRLPGSERVLLVAAIRAELGDDLDEPTLYALADFVPMGFTRVVLVGTGVSLPEHFGRQDSRNRIRKYGMLKDEPVYTCSLALAQSWFPSRADDVRYIAGWHEAFTMVETALARGSQAADLEFAPTLLNGPDSACPPWEERPTFPDRPWWLAHWKPKPWWRFW